MNESRGASEQCAEEWGRDTLGQGEDYGLFCLLRPVF